MKCLLAAASLLALFVLALVGCTLLTTEPAVDFVASAAEGRAPLAVRFTPQVDGTPILYAWNFGDGHTSEEPSPVHVYNRHGTYSVMLTVGYVGGDSVTRIKKRLVTVDPQLAQATMDYLYWVSWYTVCRGTLDGSYSEPLAGNWEIPSGMDVAGGRVYWVRTGFFFGVLESRDVEDRTDREDLIEEENRLGDVAVDAKHGKVYWTSLPDSPQSEYRHKEHAWDGGIRRANLDGSNVETLIEYPSGSAAYADRIAVDPETELLVWSLVGDGFDGVIQMSSVSPFDPVDLVKDVGRPRGLALDTIPGFGANNVYFTTSDELRRAGLHFAESAEDALPHVSEGTTILTGLDTPSGVAIDPINHYVYVGSPKGILRATTDGTEAEVLFPDEEAVGPVALSR